MSTPPPRPSKGNPRTLILTSHIHIATLQLIAALLLLLMLLWHISTVSLVENYMMPDWWVAEFLRQHVDAWRMGVWNGVGVLIPLDCGHALLCLDWWCAMLYSQDVQIHYEKGKEVDDEKPMGNNAQEDVEVQSRQHLDYETHASSTSRTHFHPSDTLHCRASSTKAEQPHTYHPLITPCSSPLTRRLLLSTWDILLIAILAAHIVTYFVSLPIALALCNLPRVSAHPYIEFPAMDRSLSMRDACVGLNMDIHVAGGFAVFMALVLGMLHVAALAVRGWEYASLGREGVAGRRKDDGHRLAVGVVGEQVDATVDTAYPRTSALHVTSMRSGTARAASVTSTAEPRNTASIGGEEQSTVRSVGWSADRAARMARRRAIRTQGSEASKADSKWTEALLECQIDS